MLNAAVKEMNWIKQGLIYCPDAAMPWAQQSALMPIPHLISPQCLRIFLSFCDQNMIGRVGYIDVDPANPKKILAISSHPILDIGEPGRFDENGVIPTSVLMVGDKLYMYYVGFQLGKKIPYYQFSGLAVSVDGGNSFCRVQQVPVLDRTDEETLNRTAPFVIFDQSYFRMWYVAGSRWTIVNGKQMPIYNIRYIESVDGVHWPGEGQTCIDFASDDEYVIGRPWVLKTNNLYKMFFCSRTYSKDYRLGYAESKDGINWQRLDQSLDGLGISASGWDCQMMAYPSVFSWEDKTYLFYNGNNCGRTGFGFALLLH